jgi:iron complex outermembrane receptor protein
VGAPSAETNLPFGENAPPHILIPAEFGNGLVGTTRGFEVAPEWRPSDSIRLRASYSFLDMDIRRGTNSLDVGSAPFVNGSSPENELTAGSDFHLPKNLRLDLTYRFVSDLAALNIPSYSTADAQLEWNLYKGLTLAVVGRNLLQPYHYESASDPGPNVGISRGGYVKLSWKSE